MNRMIRWGFHLMAGLSLNPIAFLAAHASQPQTAPDDPPVQICIFFWSVRAFLLWLGLLFWLLWLERRGQGVE